MSTPTTKNTILNVEFLVDQKKMIRKGIAASSTVRLPIDLSKYDADQLEVISLVINTGMMRFEWPTWLYDSHDVDRTLDDIDSVDSLFERLFAQRKAYDEKKIAKKRQLEEAMERFATDGFPLVEIATLYSGRRYQYQWFADEVNNICQYFQGDLKKAYEAKKTKLLVLKKEVEDKIDEQRAKKKEEERKKEEETEWQFLHLYIPAEDHKRYHTMLDSEILKCMSSTLTDKTGWDDVTESIDIDLLEEADTYPRRIWDALQKDLGTGTISKVVYDKYEDEYYICVTHGRHSLYFNVPA